MTTIKELEANFKQYQAKAAASEEATTNRLNSMQAEASSRMDAMQETMKKKFAESDKKFDEILRLLKTFQPPTTTDASTTQLTTIPAITQPATLVPPPLNQTFQSLPHPTAPPPPPHRTHQTLSSVSPFTPPTQPFCLYNLPTNPMTTQTTATDPYAAYTSFSGLQFDAHGFPLPTEDAVSNQNHRAHTTAEGIFQSNSDQAYGYNTGMFSNTITPRQGYGRGWNPGTDHRLRKLKMSLFDGEDVYGWLYQTERFFEVQGLVTAGDRLRATVLSLEGPALSWFRWINNREPFRSWEELKRRLLHRFQPSQDRNLHEQFFSISQQGTAREYVTLFEKMAAQLPGLTDEVLEGIFIQGLKPDLRTAVRTQQPVNLIQATDLTLLIDESKTGATNDQKSEIAPKTPTTRSAEATTDKLPQPLKPMTATEVADKKAKGLCFRCDGKFAPGHRCPPKTLHVLLVDEEDADEEGPHPHAD